MRHCSRPITGRGLRLLLLLLAVSTLPAMSVQAGILSLGNGDRISGGLIGIYEGQVHWQSDLMGEVVVGQVDVLSIESDDHFRVVLDARREMTQCQLQASGDRQLLNCQQGMVELNSWRLVQSVTARPLLPRDEWRKTGFVTVAARDRGGNSQDRTLQLDSHAELRKGPVRHIATVHYDRTSTADVKSADNRKVTYQFDYFFSDKWFFNSNATLEQDQFQALERRTLLGAGLGYQFFDTEFIRLSMELGPAFLREIYSTEPQRSASAIRASTDLRMALNGRGLEFFHRNTLLDSLDGSGDWRIETESGFSLPIIGKLRAQATLDFDYNRRPAEDVGPLDRTWSFGLNYAW